MKRYATIMYFLRHLLGAMLLAVICFFGSCNRNEPSPPGPTPLSISPLQLITTYTLSVTEPSGLAYSPAAHTLYMISDNRTAIFTIDTTGRVLTSTPVTAQDIEGIAVSATDDTLFVVEETASQITAFSRGGAKLWSHAVKVWTDPKHALEGITIDDRGRLYIINEKLPMLVLEFAGSTEMSRTALAYTTDVSDICFDPAGGCFWIVSDESQQVLKMSKSGALLGRWFTPVQQGRSIALIGNRLYIVSDAKATLYVFVRPE